MESEIVAIDVNKERRHQLTKMPSAGAKVLTRLYGVDEKLVFYYDETNNIRKLYLKEGGTNYPELRNFILGGVAHRAVDKLPDEAELRDLLRIQTSAPEIHFELVAKGEYPNVLKSEKLKIFLRYLLRNRIYIHYYNLNPVYWSLVDVIDSILADDRFRMYAVYHLEIKNELYAVVSKELDSLWALLHSYNYPNVGKEKTREFSGAVLSFVNFHMKTPRNGATPILKHMLEEAGELDELAFLVDNKNFMLIEGLHPFYIRPICLFRKSEHIFDEEREVQKHVSKMRFINGTKEIPVSFVDSTKTFGVQLSDVVCGLLGKHFTFIENHSMHELRALKASMNDTQRENLRLLAKLIDVSDALSDGMIFRTVPMDSDLKNQEFLFGVRVPFHLGWEEPGIESAT